MWTVITTTEKHYSCWLMQGIGIWTTKMWKAFYDKILKIGHNVKRQGQF